MIQVLRVDDRLLHGQVAVAWTHHYKVDVILVANDHLITDKNMQVAFKLATPAGVTLSMKYLNSGKKANNEWRTCINEINKKGKSKWKKKRMSCGYWNRKKLPISRTAM